jgi:hypothetical protein
VVGIGRYRNAGTVNISAVTFGGVAANLVAGSGVGLGSTATGVVWYQLGVAAGTTSTIVVTWTASANNCAIAVYSLYGLISSTVNDVRTDSATAYSLPFTNPAGAILLAMGMSTAVTTVSWAGVTENFDAQSEAAMTYSGGSIANAGASTTVTPTWTSETGLVVSGVAYV